MSLVIVNPVPQLRSEPEPERTPLEGLIRRHHARLRRFAGAILVDRARIDDVLQEAYLKTYRSGAPRFESEAHELAWLHKVVYRCCIDELRRAKRTRETPALLEAVAAPGDPLMRTLADEAWRSLSDQDRAVLLLVDVAGFDYGAAARLLRLPRGTVASRLSTARDRLRRRIADE
jgi:RNA polymerase sigma-70 factor (ECF subfamily)